MKFETAAQKYLECARKRLRPTSYATYMQLLNERVLPFWEGKKLAKIKNEDALKKLKEHEENRV